MPRARAWIDGARPRTLVAAIVPVFLGVAVVPGGVAVVDLVVRGGLAAIVSLALQVAVNYANDYSDGVRGTDDERVGPRRLVASGDASPESVRRAAFVAIGVAVIAGGLLAAMTTWWLVLVGAASIAAAWGYTGGPRPYGYSGWGEVFVFVFFGLVATMGTTYVVAESWSVRSFIVGSIAGLLAVALLVVNNLRDLDNDARVGKRTMAVRLGDRATRRLYVACYVIVLAIIVSAALGRPVVLISLVGVLPAARASLRVLRGAAGRELIAVLGLTARAQLLIGVLLSLAVWTW
jgi:1,4-dihydroxy-2-naphthoate octaprenyltransferase